MFPSLILPLSRVHHSNAEDQGVVRRSQLSVAKGLAAAFHAYLTNAIVGIDHISMSHVDELKVYKTRNCIEEDKFTRISDKVFVLFPES